MDRTALLGGVGGIVFGVLSFVSLFVAAPIGGSYKASDAVSYVASGHRPAVFVSVYLALISILGLIGLLARLREVIDKGEGQSAALRIFWGTGLAAASSSAIGWVVAFAVPLAYAYAGNGFSIPVTVTYAITEAGAIILYGAGGVLLGFALIALALGARTAFPSWLRWLTLVVGIVGLASLAFFPWFLLPLWGIVTGVWMLVSGRNSSVT